MGGINRKPQQSKGLDLPPTTNKMNQLNISNTGNGNLKIKTNRLNNITIGNNGNKIQKSVNLGSNSTTKKMGNNGNQKKNKVRLNLENSGNRQKLPQITNNSINRQKQISSIPRLNQRQQKNSGNLISMQQKSGNQSGGKKNNVQMKKKQKNKSLNIGPTTFMELTS